MNDTDKVIFEEMREFRKEVMSNFVIVHNKVDTVKTDLEAKISGVKTDVQDGKESFIVFKAKWFGVGAVAIFVGNLIKPLIHFLKDSH